MRTLLLLRHAKSSWDDPELSDHERPLAKRGTKDATRMGHFLDANDLGPDLVLCSGAVRARATLALVLAAMGTDGTKVIHDDALYLAEPDQILQRLADVEAAVQQVMVVGHNPGMHALALALVGSGEAKAIADMALKFPTAALAVIDFTSDSWGAVEAGSGALRLFIVPRRLV